MNIVTQADFCNSLRWKLLSPIVWYMKSFPIRHGKTIALRVVDFVLPSPPEKFRTTLPGQCMLDMLYTESLGRSTLFFGSFEQKELQYVADLLEPGDAAIDIGANIGLFTVVMSRMVGDSGKLLAIDPIESNLKRVADNLALNGLNNVDLEMTAIGEEDGETEFVICPSDTAFSGRDGAVKPYLMADAKSVKVGMRTLDSLLAQKGFGKIKLLKIDVEGGEERVLQGARETLSRHKPILLMEANSEAERNRLKSILAPYGYGEPVQPKGFKAHNYIYRAE